MRRLPVRQLAVGAVLVAALSACLSGAATEATATCVPGAMSVCACYDGRSGAQRCQIDGTYSDCQCLAGDAGDSGDLPDTSPGETGAIGDTGPAEVPVVECPPAATLADGAQSLLALFVVEQGVILVRPDAISLVDRGGATSKIVSWPREILSAALEGSTFVVADRAAITKVAVPTLAPGAPIFVVEPCAAGVVLSGGRYVCGPASDWERVFYTYDLASGALLAKSKPSTYAGTLMRRVPGTDDFLTVSDGSSGFCLFTTLATGEAVRLTDSPSLGVAASPIFAFQAPADRVVNQQGIYLRIHSPTCTSGGTGCFAKEGALGTLVANQIFVAMTDEGGNDLYGVVSTPTGSYREPPCKTLACDVQKLDAATHTVTSSRSRTIPQMSRAIVMRRDPFCERLVLGYTRLDSTTTTGEGGHGVVTLEY
jgi:hypothetical protein